jgi:hypothetical protein
MINISFHAEEKVRMNIQKASSINHHILTFSNPTDGSSNILMVVLSAENLETIKLLIEEVNS